MRILHRQVLGSHLLNLGMTLMVFTFVLLLGNIFKDMVALLANRSVGILTMGRFFLLLLPCILSFSLPMALLAATLLVMGRISADNELTACRACGVSFFELVLPMLGVAAALSFISLYVNSFLAPQTKYLFNHMFVDIAFDNPIALLEEGQWIRDFEGYVIFIDKKDIDQQTLKNVRVMKMDSNEMVQDIHAERGTLTANLKQLTMKIILYNARVDQRDPSDPENITKRKWNMTVAEYPIELDMTKLVDQRRAKKEIHHYNSLELWDQALEIKAKKGGNPAPILVELHKRVAYSMACISFVLVALPLGVQIHRRETSIGILISLLLAVFWYFTIQFAEGFKENPQLYPELIIWIPNLVFQVTGLYLLWKQSKI